MLSDFLAVHRSTRPTWARGAAIRLPSSSTGPHKYEETWFPHNYAMYNEGGISVKVNYIRHPWLFHQGASLCPRWASQATTIRTRCYISSSGDFSPAKDLDLPPSLQSVHKLRLIYNSSWIGINERENVADHKDAIQFSMALHRILGFILVTDPNLDPAYLCKVDPSDAYMRLWVRPEDTPQSPF